MSKAKDLVQKTIDLIVVREGSFKVERLLETFLVEHLPKYTGPQPLVPDVKVTYVKTFPFFTIGFATTDNKMWYLKDSKSGGIYFSESKTPCDYATAKALDSLTFIDFFTGKRKSGGAKSGASSGTVAFRTIKAGIPPTPVTSTSASMSGPGKIIVVADFVVALTMDQRKAIALDLFLEKPDDLINIIGPDAILEKIGASKALEYFS